MKQILLLLCMLPFAAIPAFLLMQIKSGMRNYYLLISFFLNQLSLVMLIGANPQGIYQGASIFVNLSIIYVSAVPLLVLCLSRPPKQKLSEKKVLKFDAELLKWSWIVIYVLGFYSSILATTKLMPIATTFMFGVVLYFIISGDFNFETLLEAIYKFFGIVATLLNLTFIFRFDWSKFSDQTQDILNTDSSTYFSPLAEIFGLPVRLSGPFSSSQTSGVFSVFGVACYLSSKNPNKNKFLLGSLVAFGSFSGSRTFYLTLTCLIFYHMLNRFLPKEAIAFWIFLFASFASLTVILYQYILPLISPNQATLSSLTGRTKLWELILNDWSSEGYFGHGPNSLTQYSLEHVYFPFAHAHNSFLQYLWDFGLLGLFAVLMMIASLLFASSSKLTDRNQVVTLILVLLLIQTEPTIRVGTSIAGWFWLVPLTYVYSRARESKNELDHKRTLRR